MAETELTASAGVSLNKFLAKLASDQRKPNGQFAIMPDEAEAFVVVRVRSDKTRVDRKSVGADQTLRQAPLNDGLEKAAQHVALAKAPVSVLRERRVMGSSAVQSESAEPAIGEIEVNLFAKATLGPNARALDHQLWIDRSSAHLLKRLQRLAKIIEFEVAVDALSV